METTIFKPSAINVKERFEARNSIDFQFEGLLIMRYVVMMLLLEDNWRPFTSNELHNYIDKHGCGFTHHDIKGINFCKKNEFFKEQDGHYILTSKFFEFVERFKIEVKRPLTTKDLRR